MLIISDKDFNSCHFFVILLLLMFSVFCFVAAATKLLKLSYSDLYDGVRRINLRAIVYICHDLCFGV